MKIEKINDNKIKITLSAKDLADRNLDFRALKYNSPAAQTLFWDMMKKAEAEHGFSASNCQLFIEAASVMDGNFIVTITKINDAHALPQVPYPKVKPAPSTLKVKRKSAKYSKNCIFCFTTFDDLADMSMHSELPSKINSSLYEYKDKYYLIITPTLTQLEDSKKLLVILDEFGEIVTDFNYTVGVLSEYGNKIINKNALKILIRANNEHS